MDMPQDDNHTIDIVDKIVAYWKEPINTNEQVSIYRVPSHIRKNNESYYEPMMVSIGPYHQGKDHLCAMQQHKKDYLREFIDKGGGSGTVKDYIQAIRKMEHSIRACYFETFNMDEETFVETMLLDSCFIIQLFNNWIEDQEKKAPPTQPSEKKAPLTQPSENKAPPTQPSDKKAHLTHSIGWALPFIMADLTMIENQIPFFVLEEMYKINCQGSSSPPDNLQDGPEFRSSEVTQSLGFKSGPSDSNPRQSIEIRSSHIPRTNSNPETILSDGFESDDLNPKSKHRVTLGDPAPDGPSSLTELLVKSLLMMHNGNKPKGQKMPKAGTNIKHLLDLYYFLFVPAPKKEQRDSNENYRNHGILQSINSICGGRPRPRPKKPKKSLSDCYTLRKRRDGKLSPRMIPSAKELQEFGVTFKKKKKEDFHSFLDISFHNGVLEMPCIVVEKAMRSRYLNLVAFDQCRSTNQKHLTSYAVFLDFLINTSEDVIVLQRCGIIENMLSDTAEAAQFFNQLGACAFMDFDNHYLRKVFIDLTLYSQSWWPKHKARLRRDYFSNPWSIIAFCAASLVLGITIFNTIYFIVTTFF